MMEALVKLAIVLIFIPVIFGEQGKSSSCGCGATNREAGSLSVEKTDKSCKDVCHSSERPGKPNYYQMELIDGGRYEIGTDDPVFEADGEAPSRTVVLDPYYIDKYEVSNEAFAAFVQETGYETEAETFGTSFVFEGILSPDTKQGITQVVAAAPWWFPIPNTDWAHPEGPNSSIIDRMDHPVIHISWNDALEFCHHHGKRLPTEAEWEVACRGGLKHRLFPWGNKLNPHDEHRTNIWQGRFPSENTMDDGYLSTAPVNSFPPNKYGLHNMVGNVWEWTADWWQIKHSTKVQRNPTGPSHGMDRVKKGGSYMCHYNTCYRYRCAARSQNTPDSSSSNLGFRCAVSAADVEQ